MTTDTALPPMWTESIDQRTGETYYYNVLTAERTKQRPLGKAYDRKPSKRSSEGILPSSSSSGGGVRTPYAFYTDEYKLEKYRAMDRDMDLDKSRSHSKRKTKPRYKDYSYGDERNIEDEDNDSYGVILDSYSSDGSDSNPQRGERSTATTEKSSSSHKDHHHHRSSHKRSASKSKSRSKSKSKRLNSRSHSPTHKGDTRSKSPLRSKSMHSSSNQRHDSQHRRKKRLHANSSHSHDAASDHKSKKTTEAKAILQQLEEERRKLDEKKQKLAEKEKELQQQKEAMEQERKKQEEELKEKAAMEEKERREAFEKEETIRRSLLQSETTRQAKEAEEMARQLEQRTQQLREKEKQLEEERRSMLQKLKQEEEKRQQQAALEEQARREAFEKEETRRLQMIRMQTKRQVKEAEEKAQKKAREAEEARRKAEEKAEQARQQAAALEMARLKAEQEAQLAKQKAALQEEAHLQAVREAQRAKKDALATKEQQDRALKKAQNAAVEAERKRVQAERKAHLEEQKRFKEELKRQRLEESMAASYDDHEFYTDDSAQSQSSSSSESVSLDDDDDDEWTSNLKVEDDREGSAANQDSMERSMDIQDVFDDNSPSRSVQRASTARERKRELEMKYQSGQASADTVKSSGVNDASAGTMTSKGEKGLRGEGEDPGPVKSGRRWFQRRVPREQAESGNRSGQVKSSEPHVETKSTAVVHREAETTPEIPKSGRRWFRRSKSLDAEELEALARDDQGEETRPGLLRQLSRPGIQRTSSDANRPEILRQGSRPGIHRTPSDSKRPDMQRQGSRPGIQRTTSGDVKRPSMFRQLSRPGIERASSDANRPEMKRQGSRPGIQRSTSSDTNKPGMFRQGSRSGIQRSSSDSKQIERMRRDPDRRDGAPRSKSMDPIRREDSGRPAMRRTKSSDMSNFNNSFQMPAPPQAKKKMKRKMEYERPPKSLVVIWLLVAGKLGFDLGTTIIAVRALMEEDNCCGFPIKLGPIPMSITFPFFALVATELAMLFQAIIQTLCPNIMEAQQDVLGRSTFIKYVCCCFRWNVQVLMRTMSFLLLLNPFFGCLIAWMLLYQSDKTDAFTVLGFEGGSLALHYISVCLEGSITGLFTFIQNGLLPLVPFAVSVGMVLFYLKQGGVCYIVADQTFNFNGCEVCLNGYPPVNGTCRFANGTTYAFQEQSVFDLSSYNSLESIVSRTAQDSYCAYENPSGPDINFCFYDFEDGLLDGRVENETMSEILNATNTTVKTNKCGGTVPPGARQAQCHQYLWDLVNDDTFHCLSRGGPGDPCQLDIQNDGENEGRFKDPSACQPNSALSDTFYLWEEPLANGKDYAWAGNSWLAYSATRWIAQVEAMREMGVRVASAAVRYESPEQVREQFTEFFDACRPSCVTPDDPSYVDILALRVFCDPDVEFCDRKVEEVTGVLMDLSESFNSRPVHITAWGVLKTDETTKLLEAMKATNGFFENGSPVERVYWWGGGATDFTNLLKTVEGQDKTLGNAWVDFCKAIN